MHFNYISKTYNIPYSVWCIDKLVDPYYFKQVLNPKNIILFTTYKNDSSHPGLTKNIKTYYLPYTYNVLQKSIPKKIDKYNYDISFIGSPLLKHSNDYPVFINFLKNFISKSEN